MKVKLAGIIELIGGGTPKTSEPLYWGGDIPWLSVADFNNDERWVYETEKSITEIGLKNSSTKMLIVGDIIVSARGTVGVLAQLSVPMAFNQSCYGIRTADPKVLDQGYLYYLLIDSVDELKRRVHGGVFDTITRDTFDQIEIDLPDFPTQKKIAEILGALDEKIALNRQTNRTLETLAQTLFQKTFLSTPEAEDWEDGKLGDIMTNFDSKRVPLSSRQRAERKGGYRYVGATSVMDYVDDSLFNDIYLLIAEDGSVIKPDGTPYLQYIWGKFWLNNHAHIIQAKPPFSTEYIYVLLSQTNVNSLISGAVQLKINQKAMNTLPIKIPPVELLTDFNEKIAPIFAKIRNNSEQTQTLTHLRQTLLPKLISGEIKV
jgi:type I restriction enzyme S subunit